MASLTRGTTFVTGVANDVTADKLHALVDAATPTSGFIQDRTSESAIASNDTLLFGDASASDDLKRITVANFRSAATFGTTTSTAATITSGTITTLNSTTGTITTGVIPTLTSTTLITTGTGTAASPAIVPTGDTNTGFFFPAADTIAFSEGGAEAMRIDSSGNVGIGTTSPANKISVESSGANSSEIDISLVSGTGNKECIINFGKNLATNDRFLGRIFYQVDNNVMGFNTNNTERLRITSDGFMKASDAGTYVNSAASYHELRNSASEPTLLASNSNAVPQGIQIRFTSAPNDATSQFLNCNDGNGSTNRAIIRSNGGIQNYQANDGNLSDERLKTDIQPSPSYLDKICSIPVVNFKYKDQTHDDYNLGVIAQQVESVCPEFVDADGVGETPEDGIPIKAIYQTDLQYALMKCIQELKSENDSLKSRIESLEAK